MGINRGMQGDSHVVEHCSTREICPLGLICGVSRKREGKPLFPRIQEVQKGELIWTNVCFENIVYIVRKGALVSAGIEEHEEDVPFALLGKGNSVGLADIYSPGEISDFYYLRNLIPGEVCAFSAKAVRRKIEELPQRQASQLLSCAFISQTSASYVHTRIISRRFLPDRILFLLLYLQDTVDRQDTTQDTLEITHEEIAQIVLSDRVSTTRVLNKMCEDGIVSLNYKSITIHSDKLDDDIKRFDTHSYLIALREGSKYPEKASILASLPEDPGQPMFVL